MAGVPVASTSPPASNHGPQRRAGSSIVPCPGFPLRASGAVYHSPTFATAGTSGASQVLRRLSSCMPRPVDSGGPHPPRQGGWARVAFGCVKSLGVRNKRLFEAVPALQGARSPLRPPGCAVSAAPILFAVSPRLRPGRQTRSGWVASPYPTGTCTLLETPSCARRDHAAAQPRLKAAAQRTLEGVACTRLFGLAITLRLTPRAPHVVLSP